MCGTKKCKNRVGEPHHRCFACVVSVSLRSKFFKGIRVVLTCLQRAAKGELSIFWNQWENSHGVRCDYIWGKREQLSKTAAEVYLSTSKRTQPGQTSSTVSSAQNQCWRQTARHKTKPIKINAKSTTEQYVMSYMRSTKYLLYPVSLGPGYLIVQALCYITSLFLTPGQAKGTTAQATSHVPPLQK